MSISFFKKYSFTKEAIEHLKNLEIDIFSLSEQHPDVLNAAVENIEMILDRGEYNEKELYQNEEILVYPISKMLIELINNDYLRYKFADVVSKRTSKLLSKENFNLINNIAKNTFDWNLSFEDLNLNIQYDCKMKFHNYLSVAPNFRDSIWKLINRRLDLGWVFLKKQEIIRLISEKVKQDIIKKPIKKKELPKIPNFLEEKVKNLQNSAQKYESKLQTGLKGKLITSKETYPPCIVSILKELQKGVNLDHTSRLVFIFFLLNTEKPIEEIVDLFRTQPDFNEAKTTYYVEHAAGERGSGTKYSSYGCPKIKTYGLCKEKEDFWCHTKKINHPIQYFERKNWKIQNVIIPKILAFPLLITSNKKYDRNFY
ncbi:MAG: hypothetical protein HWN67_10810 [Candidatus Helarchaeota archaeon]|nr:hypothetical protein [Candidatus Helarchaeota archaeon]